MLRLQGYEPSAAEVRQDPMEGGVTGLVQALKNAGMFKIHDISIYYIIFIYTHILSTYIYIDVYIHKPYSQNPGFGVSEEILPGRFCSYFQHSGCKPSMNARLI